MSSEMATTNDTRKMGRSQVADFYSGRKLFVTGATGFMGKVLIHKLLTSSPDIGGIYVLIRPKRGQEPKERLKAVLEAAIFEGMDKELLDKVVALAGDITSPKLGLSEEDESRLVREVSVVFHSAATVKFDEDLSKSVTMNIQGTLAVIDLARKMGSNLASFVHVSTAYSHCYMSHIEEKFYDNETSPNEVIEMVKRISASVIDEPDMTKKLIGKHPNTYTFTKALAEQAVLENAKDLPLSIFRPSIVVASAKEPVPGWIDNLNGPTGISAGYAAGILRTIRVTRKNRADVIPVDFVINMMCVIGWKTGTTAAALAAKTGSVTRELDENANTTPIPIYNFTSGADRPLRWMDYEEYGNIHVPKYPLEDMLWVPGGSFKDSVIADRVCRVLYHFIPALLFDVGLRLVGKKPYMWKLISKMTKAMRALEFFSTREWDWTNDNVHRLNQELTDTDKQLFNCDLKKLPAWSPFIETYVLGIRHYLLKNKPSSLDRCRRKYKVMYVADILIKCLVLFLLYKFLSWMFLS